MKKMVFALLAALAAAQLASAQAPSYNYHYTWGTVTTTGPVGTLGTDQYLDFTSASHGSTGEVFTIDWSVTGTPSACTFQIEGSSDLVNWYSIASSVGSPLSCTSSNMISVAYKPVLRLRVNVLSFTGTGSTVIFHFTGVK